jgi:hypothetical protein
LKLASQLNGGVLQAIYDATYDPDRGTANYEDGAVRYYSCQTCHMRAVTGTGANKRGVPVRTDLPLHDMTGGNYWMAEAIQYLDNAGKLRLGGGMSAAQVQAMQDGQLRALEQLQLAATLEVDGETVRVINHTGHKLITGYPEGRRMWLRIRWFDNAQNSGTPLREDGAYGPIGVSVVNPRTGESIQVESIKDLQDPNTVIYQAHMGMTQKWASQLLSLGFPAGLPLAYDRESGNATTTLGELAGMSPFSIAETFHFALNNVVVEDNRIPPYGMKYDEARLRNALPQPQTLYGDPGESGTYQHYDAVSLNPPLDAVSATIDLLYQPTSWEYVQFLYLANQGSNAFLADEGSNMLEAWLNTGMAAPIAMASASWPAGGPAPEPGCDAAVPALTLAEPQDKSVALSWTDVGEPTYRLYYDQSDKAQLIVDLTCASEQCLVYTDTGLTNGQSYCYKVASFNGTCESAFSDPLCATPQNQGQTALLASADISAFGVWVQVGKGKAATQELLSADIVAGDEVGAVVTITSATGQPVAGATAHVTITGPITVELATSASDAAGYAELHWQTQAPNRRGSGGTPTGHYTARVTGLTSNTYTWDGVWAAQEFDIN